MRLLSLAVIAFLLVNACSSSNSENEEKQVQKKEVDLTERQVIDNVIISEDTPSIKIKVDDEFAFVGKFDFEIIASSEEYPEDLIGKPIASGERLVFLKSDQEQSVEKLFIVQFEGFLPENDLIYNYDFSKAESIGSNKYRHNTWIYDARSMAEQNPSNEGAKTIKFIEDKGFTLQDYFMMSRFVGLASEDRKNEIIIFYQEMLTKTTGLTLDEYEQSTTQADRETIINSLVERSRNSFEIIEG